MKTIFEKIIDREIPANIVYEDSDFLAILDIQPKTKGHTLVIPKKPFKNLLEISEEVQTKYLLVVEKVAKGVQDSLSSDGFNLVMNNGEAAGQEVFHAHMHIIPRYENDSVDISPGTYQEYESPEEAEGFANKIKNRIKI
jgi:histidine triad (HIT) family protein